MKDAFVDITKIVRPFFDPMGMNGLISRGEFDVLATGRQL